MVSGREAIEAMEELQHASVPLAILVPRPIHGTGKPINVPVKHLRWWYLKIIETFAEGNSSIALWHAKVAGGLWCDVLGDVVCSIGDYSD